MITIRLEGDITTINDITKFTNECTTYIRSIVSSSDVECGNVRAGSIVVDIHGSTNSILNAIDTHLDTNPMKLPTFGSFNKSNYLFFLPWIINVCFTSTELPKLILQYDFSNN